jgi:hypothetical protein
MLNTGQFKKGMKRSVESIEKQRQTLIKKHADGYRRDTKIKERLLDRIKIAANGCWEWQGTRDPDGYGRLNYRKQQRAHRISAILFLDMPEDSGLLVCHRCDNPPCVNPDHLFIGTWMDNRLDMLKKGKGLHVNEKLTHEQADEIKKLASQGVPPRTICKRFLIHRSTVWRIKKNINYTKT